MPDNGMDALFSSRMSPIKMENTQPWGASSSAPSLQANLHINIDVSTPLVTAMLPPLLESPLSVAWQGGLPEVESPSALIEQLTPLAEGIIPEGIIPLLGGPP